ncbi:MAG: SRPBCC family protein [Synechococcales bacterium]|nr:SRPBCC family protein [Synechococcales bacterium]
MRGFWQRLFHRNFHREPGWVRPLAATFEVASSASVDDVWRKVVNLADVSWHPLLSSTNVPYGLIPKPGFIYKAVTRLSPFPIQIFVERVCPKELLSIRILAIPGVEERVIYRVESTVWGAQVSYSVTLKGWLSPLIWSVIRPYAERVAADLVQAAERSRLQPTAHPLERSPRVKFYDLLSTVLVCSICSGIGQVMV